MGSRQLDPQDLQAIRKLAKEWGKIVSRRAFGEEGPDVEVNFAAMEDIALAASQGLSEGALEEMLVRQAQRYGTEQPCPECGRIWPMEPETRTLVVRGGGEVEHSEPQGYCRLCRRAFFPSAGPPGAGSSGLQSSGADQDRDGGRGAEVVRRGGQGVGRVGRGDDQ